MPPTQSHDIRSHPQQRRTFRGRGGPTDGNLPPKKNVRHRVKYHGVGGNVADSEKYASYENNDSNIGIDLADRHSNRWNDDGAIISEKQLQLQRLTISNHKHDSGEHSNAYEDKLLLEIKHLRRRVQHLVDSFQTSLGLGNPIIWQSNCLLPAKNAINEWRSIVKFYNLKNVTSRCFRDEHDEYEDKTKEEYRGYSDPDSSLASTDERCVHNCIRNKLSTNNIILSTAQEVFALVQMSIQVGPLSGSNPGYFKRCGGEVAAIALAFLSEIVDIKIDDFHEQVEDDGSNNSIDGSHCEGSNNHFNDHQGETKNTRGVDTSDNLHDIEWMQLGKKCHDSDMESASDSKICDNVKHDNSKKEKIVPSNNDTLAFPYVTTKITPIAPPLNKVRREESNNGAHHLQESLLFTSNQSKRFHQWMCNAEIASRKNDTPSKSALKVQSSKSKKQKQKELKIKRKIKKEKREGRVVDNNNNILEIYS